MADKLAHQHGQIGKGKFEELEKAYGLKYEPGGIVYDAYVRSIYNPIDNTFWDPMHILVASSGVAQYEGNGFLYVAVHEFGVSLEDIDAWSKELRWPARNTTACVKVFTSVCLPWLRPD